MSNFTFIVADDDRLVLNNLNLIISKFFPNVKIRLAENGEVALKFIEENKNNCIVISDIYMPKVTGFDILEKIRNTEELKDTYLILMTGASENDLGVKALQKGADDILHKPLNVDSLIARLRVASKYINFKSQIAEKEEKILNAELELKNEKDKFISTLNKIIEVRLPEKIKNIENVEKIAEWIAHRISNFNQAELNELKVAAKLLYIGNMALPDTSINASVMKDGFLANPTMQKVPHFAYELLKDIKVFENVAHLLFHIFENHDGTGYPHKLKLWQIPKSSKILRVIRDYFQLTIEGKMQQHRALDTMFAEVHRLYDWEILVYLDQYLANYDPSPTRPERKVLSKELEEGMTVSRSIYSVSGHLLVSRNVKLTAENIMKIKQIKHQEGILGSIYVFDSIKKAKELIIDPNIKI